MNREIMFRGKRMDNGEWVEGNLFIPDKVTRTVVPTEILMGTNLVRISYEVDPATVGQYTGLTDKKGKKIFEGDIVSDEIEHKNAVITFERCAFWLNYPDHTDLNDNEWADITDQLTIIGNIHDNPELLEGGAEDA